MGPRRQPLGAHPHPQPAAGQGNPRALHRPGLAPVATQHARRHLHLHLDRACAPRGRHHPRQHAQAELEQPHRRLAHPARQLQLAGPRWQPLLLRPVRVHFLQFAAGLRRTHRGPAAAHGRGFVEPTGGLPPHTVAALRKYDIASRTQHKLDLMATFILPRDMTVYVSARADRNHYDARIGRQKLDSYATSVQWEWQPDPDTTASAWYGHDRSELVFANVNDAVGSDPQLGGPTYPEANRWWMDDTQRNHYAGLNLSRRLGRASLDLAWNWTSSRGRTGYRMNSPGALTVPANAALASGSYPVMVYRVNSLTAGLSMPLGQRVRLRVFDTWERGNLSDWHYFGFEDTLVYDHRVYVDGGPSSYRVNLLGMMLEVAL
ncbi:MtrB/PioB family outer membrane beta-barrel protein [Stenotrophomonas acidaminiphila]|nr:MtrB/PioB family outer membrane beta-barrel protein [Stenotrophomonas acidaminiphila]